jgi:tRNA pseudouridine38-40 synthase
VNYKLLIQYDGTDFHGWQVQAGDRTIQGELERVIGTLEDAPVSVVGSGRTDAGVHAKAKLRMFTLLAALRLIVCGRRSTAIFGATFEF